MFPRRVGTGAGWSGTWHVPGPCRHRSPFGPDRQHPEDMPTNTTWLPQHGGRELLRGQAGGAAFGAGAGAGPTTRWVSAWRPPQCRGTVAKLPTLCAARTHSRASAHTLVHAAARECAPWGGTLAHRTGSRWCGGGAGCRGQGTSGVCAPEGHKTNTEKRTVTGLSGGHVAVTVFCVFWTLELVFDTTKYQSSETLGRGKVLILLGLPLTPRVPNRHGAA